MQMRKSDLLDLRSISHSPQIKVIFCYRWPEIMFSWFINFRDILPLVEFTVLLQTSKYLVKGPRTTSLDDPIW